MNSKTGKETLPAVITCAAHDGSTSAHLKDLHSLTTHIQLPCVFIHKTHKYIWLLLFAGEHHSVSGPCDFLISIMNPVWSTLQALQWAVPLEIAPSAGGAAARAGRFLALLKPHLYLTSSFYLEKSIPVFSGASQWGDESWSQKVLPNGADEGWAGGQKRNTFQHCRKGVLSL